MQYDYNCQQQMNQKRKGEKIMKTITLNTNVYSNEERKNTLKERIVNYFRENQKEILLSMYSFNMNANPYLVRQLIKK